MRLCDTVLKVRDGSVAVALRCHQLPFPVESASESSESSYSFADKGGQCGGGDDIGDSGAGVTNTRNLEMTENPMMPQSSLEEGATPQFAMTGTRQETTMEEYDTRRWASEDSQEEIHY